MGLGSVLMQDKG